MTDLPTGTIIVVRCPHPDCLVAFNDEQARFTIDLGEDADGDWTLEHTTCPTCHRNVIWLIRTALEYDAIRGGVNVENRQFVRPRATSRPKAPPEVREADPNLAADYDEAGDVLADSAKAAAALARRCLQHILREKAGITRPTLYDEIQETIASHAVPPYIAEALDYVREVGNLSAHPKKNENTGEIVDVDAGEAEATLDTVEALLQFFYVAPARAEANAAALQEKLKAAKKTAD